MTHDINGDPEIWELRELHGDRAALVWLEMLSIADRNSGVVGPDSDQTRNQLASKCRTSRVKVGLVLGWCRVKGWLVSDGYLRIAKWGKYNKTRDAVQSPSETTPRLTRHDITSKKKKRQKVIDSKASPKTEWPSPEKLVELYNKLTPDECPAVATLSPARRQKAKQYLATFPAQEFWEQVFDRVHHSRFLRGEQNKNGHGSFRFDFDWMLTKGKDGSENCLKVQEGRYADER